MLTLGVIGGWMTKARIIAEPLQPNAVTSEVARRYGLRPQQVFPGATKRSNRPLR
ncbi:MAG: hypothetical protein EOQ50_28180 [Mesorhizobium sp.]|nr:hypothetical protein EOA25_00435 [Mesorhizobium sp. M2A.F.Ca.ET.040.01.1.1]RWB68737.1 MAG: hypothetical protein EOQ50_28180 [Mesorhizobium sp.]